MTTQIDIIESKLNFGIGFIKSEQRLSLFEKNDTQWSRLGFYVPSKKRDYANTHFRKTADKTVVIEQAVIDYFQPKNIIKHAVVSYLKQCNCEHIALKTLANYIADLFKISTDYAYLNIVELEKENIAEIAISLNRFYT